MWTCLASFDVGVPILRSRLSNRISTRLWIVSLLLLVLSALPVSAAEPWCDDADAAGVVPRASDCLFILKAAIGVGSCEPCACDIDDNGAVLASDALGCLWAAVGDSPALGCPPCASTTTSSTTTTLSTPTTTLTLTTTTLSLTTTTLSTEACPDVVEWITQEARGASCATNADCAVGSCDEESSRCRTATTYDFGWDGTAHGQTLNGESRLRVRVACSPQEGGGCGECEILGIDPSAGNCRCRSDMHQTCDKPLEADPDNCRICADGHYRGHPCDDDGDCDATPCARRCLTDRSKFCSSNEDCSDGNCLEESRCETGAICSIDADCISTCTAAASCNCFDGAPQPLATPGFEACMLPIFESDVRGTVNVDTGESAIVKERLMSPFFRKATGSPCAYCGGVCEQDSSIGCLDDLDCDGAGHCLLDEVANDGERGGMCIGTSGVPGPACDVNGVNSSYPLGTSRGASGYSLDCLSNSLVASACLRGSCPLGPAIVRATETTGQAELDSNLSCGSDHPGLRCPCLICSGDLATPCNTNAECAIRQGRCSGDDVLCDSNTDCVDSPGTGPCLAGHCLWSYAKTCSNNVDCNSSCVPSTCSAYRGSSDPKPNACSDGVCTDLGDGSGECANGPIDKRCDGVLTVDGRGVVSCSSNADCETAAGCAGDGCSTCTLTQHRSCFPAPISDIGDADPEHPVTTSAFCASVGPSLLRRQNVLRAYCGGSLGRVYDPGAGACVP